MSEAFVGELRLFGFNFAPINWAFCNGQLLPISQYTALFSLLGTQFGGDGRTNFALPNLQGNVPLGQGQGAGLSNYVMGQTGGAQNVTLLQSEMPQHNHLLPAVQAPATAASPSGAMVAEGHGGGRGAFQINSYAAGATNTTLAPAAVAPAGNSLPHNNMQPSLVMNWCIALAGVYPPRS